jgi:hypothetical protein
MSDAQRPLEPDDVRALLRRLERPRGPDDMVAKVRARLAAERQAGALPSEASREPASGAEVSPEAPAPWLSPSLAASPEGPPAPPRSAWRFVVEGGVLAAAAAALVVGLWLGDQLPKGGSAAAEAAGISGAAAIPEVELAAAVLDAKTVHQLAEDAGLVPQEGPSGVAYEGDFRAVQRFLVNLRVEAARRGGEVQGFVPDAARLKLTVQTRG